MSKVVQQIMETFKGMIPDDKSKLVEQAISGFVTETESQLRKEYEQTLEESYKEWRAETEKIQAEAEKKVQETEKQALQGFEEAKQLLGEAQEKLATQAAEYEAFMEEQYAVAKGMIDEERGRNEQIELELSEAYQQQIADIKADLVEKIDEFLSAQTEEIAESVRRELRNDPAVLESKVAYDRIKDIVASSLKSEDITSSTASKVEELEESLSQLQAEVKTLKAKNLRLATENTKFQGELKSMTESTNKMEQVRKETERKIAEANSNEVEGRGRVVSEADLIKEEVAGTPAAKQTADTTVDRITNLRKDELKKLAGLK